ncbi:CLIP domain-containing serine protease B4-like [Aedes albopictus]|uniref:Peptidase S1 domain-containing protein n=1 Tax=Aedes albopictus TaxID=7160 RepID=A0ABM1XJX1_AEDAL
MLGVEYWQGSGVGLLSNRETSEATTLRLWETDLLLGGQRAFLSEFPWTAIVEYRQNTSNETGYHCGGTLINSRYVLTAAHCVQPRSGHDWEAVGVRLGEHDLNTALDCEFEQCEEPPVTVGIEKIIVHDGYSPQSKAQHDDIALIRLDRDVEYSVNVSPVCLPVEESDRTRNITGAWGVKSVGWGISESGTVMHEKFKTQLSIVDRKSCMETIGTELRDTQLCTEVRRDRDVCAADSGGLLILRSRSMAMCNILYGISSFGKSSFCGTKGDPAVFTDVTKYIEWIERNIEI